MTYWWIFVFVCYFWVYTRLAILAIVCPVPCTNCYKQKKNKKIKKSLVLVEKGKANQLLRRADTSWVQSDPAISECLYSCGCRTEMGFCRLCSGDPHRLSHDEPCMLQSSSLHFSIPSCRHSSSISKLIRISAILRNMYRISGITQCMGYT